MKQTKLNSISDNLYKYDYLSDKNSHIEVIEWGNDEGWDINIMDGSHTLNISITRGELEAINYLTKTLEYNQDE